MTNELEKQFFQCFGIEPKTTYSCYEYYTSERNIDIWGEYCTKYFEDGGECDNCDKNASIQEYPQITDRILLELTAIHSCWCLPRLCCFNVEQLKEQVLSDLTLFNDKRIELIHQVRTLFEEG